MKEEIENKIKIKQQIEKNVERLKNSLRIHNGHSMCCETKNTKLQNQSMMLYSFGGVKN